MGLSYSATAFYGTWAPIDTEGGRALKTIHIEDGCVYVDASVRLSIVFPDVFCRERDVMGPRETQLRADHAAHGVKDVDVVGDPFRRRAIREAELTDALEEAINMIWRSRSPWPIAVSDAEIERLRAVLVGK